jgi:hypothetical protein
MATFLTYRASSTPTVPGATSTKGSALTNLEVDANFRTVDDNIVAINTTLPTLSTLDNVTAMAIALG